MVAAGVRFLTTYLGFDYNRRSSAVFFDGVAFAIFGFAIATAAGGAPAAEFA